MIYSIHLKSAIYYMSLGAIVLISSIERSSYLKLPGEFYQAINPTPLSSPRLVQFNDDLAAYLFNQTAPNSLDEDTLALYAGNSVPRHLQSIALAYAGHQFGYYVPLLGDGRAVLLGEVRSSDGQCWDVQLKGSGKTMFSRMGDGRAPLAAVLREYLISEAMHALKIPTTRSLAAIASDELLYRQEGLVPSGVLTRICSSSLRIGTFEYAADRKDFHLLKSLADYAIARHFPKAQQEQYPYLALFHEVVERQAFLVAQWMGIGFIHGVMNTDNMTISGETIDYGPCAFIDEFDCNKVFSSIDIAGRYAYGNQAAIAHWNLARFRETLVPLMHDTPQALATMHELLNAFPARFHYHWNNKVRAKLGLVEDNAQTQKLCTELFTLLQKYRPDFTNTFRLMSRAIDNHEAQQQLVAALGDASSSQNWVRSWSHCVAGQQISLAKLKELMDNTNPLYIPRNHLVEKAIKQFVNSQERTLFDTLLRVLKKPYQQQHDAEYFHQKPLPHECVLQTFCGT